MAKQRPLRHGPRGGFTLIELMIAVCIIGVLASVAIPAYSRVMMNVRGAEGTAMLGVIYKHVSAYWNQEFKAERGTGGRPATQCVVNGPEPDDIVNVYVPPLWPTSEKRRAPTVTPQHIALGMESGQYYYFSYTAVPQSGACEDLDGDGQGECLCGDGAQYFLAALCDLDDDNLFGGFLVDVWSENKQLRRSLGTADLDYPPITVPGID